MTNNNRESEKPASSKRDQVLAKSGRIISEGQSIEFAPDDTAAYIIHSGVVLVSAIVDGREVEVYRLQKGCHLNGHRFFDSELPIRKSLRFLALTEVHFVRYDQDQLPDPVTRSEAYEEIYKWFMFSVIGERDGLVVELAKLRHQSENTDPSDLRRQLDEKTIELIQVRRVQDEQRAKLLEAHTDELTALQDQLTIADLRLRDSRTKCQILQRRLIIAEAANFTLIQGRDEAVSEAYKSLQDEMEEERKARLKLEEELLSLKVKAVEAKPPSSASPSSKFRMTAELLQSDELNALESAARRFRHREIDLKEALRLIAKANPGLYIPPEANRLLNGEDLTDDLEQAPAKDPVERTTAILGSDAPAAAQAKAAEKPDANATAILGSGTPQPKSTRESDRAITIKATPEAKRTSGGTSSDDRTASPQAEQEAATTAAIDAMFEAYVKDEDSKGIGDTHEPFPRSNTPAPRQQQSTGLRSNADMQTPVVAPPPNQGRKRNPREITTAREPHSLRRNNSGQTQAWGNREEPPTQPSARSETLASQDPAFAAEPDTHVRQIEEDAREKPFVSSGNSDRMTTPSVFDRQRASKSVPKLQPVHGLRSPPVFNPNGINAPPPPDSESGDDFTKPYGEPRPDNIPGPKPRR